MWHEICEIEMTIDTGQTRFSKLASHRPVHSGKIFAELRCKLVSRILDDETLRLTLVRSKNRPPLLTSKFKMNANDFTNLKSLHALLSRIVGDRYGE